MAVYSFKALIFSNSVKKSLGLIKAPSEQRKNEGRAGWGKGIR